MDNPEVLMNNLRQAKAQVEQLQAELAAKQRERDDELAPIHAKWNPVLDTVQKELDAARQAARAAQTAIDDATAPSKPAEVQEPETAPPPSETHHG